MEHKIGTWEMKKFNLLAVLIVVKWDQPSGEANGLACLLDG